MKNNKKKFYLAVSGCQMNQADSEKMGKILIDSGWKKTDVIESADLIVVVACSVRQAAVDQIYGLARNCQKRRQTKGLKLILTGCVLALDQKKMANLFDYILPINEIAELPKLAGAGSVAEEQDYFKLSSIRESDFSALVPISNGCNNFCSYCAVPYARGPEISRPAEDIIKECRELVGAGYKEIILLGQNVNSYCSRNPAFAKASAGRQENKKSRKQKIVKEETIDFPSLLKIIDAIPGDYWLRFLTSHPKDLSAELIKVMAKGKHLTPYLHLALQSGDDEILKKMNRRYTAKHYASLIKKARSAMSDLAVSTDVIVGFPGETKSQFNHTAGLMKTIGFDMAYLARYSPRPQTAAAKLVDDVLERKRNGAGIS